MDQQLHTRFYPVVLNDQQKRKLDKIRNEIANFAMLVQGDCPSGHYTDTAIYHLEVAAMFAAKAISHG